MGTTYRFIESPTEPSMVMDWFRFCSTPPEEVETPRSRVLYFRSFGNLAYGSDGNVDSTASPVVTIYLPRVVRGAIWTVGEVHFLPAKERFLNLHKLSTSFGKWLRQFDFVFSNKPGSPNPWNYYLEGSTRNYDPPIFGLPSGLAALESGRYFIGEGDTEAVIEKLCSALRLRGVDCNAVA